MVMVCFERAGKCIYMKHRSQLDEVLLTRDWTMHNCALYPPAGNGFSCSALWPWNIASTWTDKSELTDLLHEAKFCFRNCQILILLRNSSHLRNHKLHCVPWNPPFVPNHLNIILPPTPTSFWFSNQNTASISLLPHTCHRPCPSHSSWFYYLNDTWWGVYFMKLLILQLSSPCYLLPLSTKQPPQHPISQTHPAFVLLLM